MSPDFDSQDDLYTIQVHKSSLALTDNNFYSAMMLDFFHSHAQKTKEPLISSVYGLSQDLGGVFTPDEIARAANVVIAKGYVEERALPSGPFGNITYIMTIHLDKIEEDIKKYYDNELDKAIPKEKASPSQRKEERIVEFQLKRAAKLGLPATITLDEWLETLHYYSNQCAYCSGPYQVFEHFIPLIRGGGTTVSNCVPACCKCNSLKMDKHPTSLPPTSTVGQAVGRITEYLKMRVVNS